MTRCDSIMPDGTITFRPLGFDDLSLVQRWRSSPHVLRWWPLDDTSIEVIRATYVPRIEGRHPCRCYIIQIDGTRVGLIQTYLFSDVPQYAAQLESPASVAGTAGGAGVDIFIGEKSYLHQGWGPLVLRSFLPQHVFQDESTVCCTVDPDPANTTAIRAYEKAGFSFLRVVQHPEDGKSTYLMSMNREDIADAPEGLATHIQILQQLVGTEKRGREDYAIFSPGRIGRLTVPNRLVRSATWDPSILAERKINDETLEIYQNVARGGVGTIITGDFSAVPAGILDDGGGQSEPITYEDLRIQGFDRLAATVHDLAPGVAFVAQISGDVPGVGPSPVPSPFASTTDRPLTEAEIRKIVECCITAIVGLQQDGFDGVQLHAAHGGLLSRFLSPYSNRRTDSFGGSVGNRCRIIRQIVTGARSIVDDFPILIKVNGTDYLPGGVDAESFPELASEIESCGVDAIEVSGGMWDCLARSEKELGFRPVPSPEAHIRIGNPKNQSYFLPCASELNLAIPTILVGGNRDVERLEEIVQRGQADFIAMCRPLIREPDLPRRWLEGRGRSGTDCFSCNGCLYEMWTRLEQGKQWSARCLALHDHGKLGEAQRWLSNWVPEKLGENLVDAEPATEI